MKKVVLFKEQQVRRVWNGEAWWFVISDEVGKYAIDFLLFLQGLEAIFPIGVRLLEVGQEGFFEAGALNFGRAGSHGMHFALCKDISLSQQNTI